MAFIKGSIVLLVVTAGFFSCKKNTSTPVETAGSPDYGDSVLYVRNQQADYIVYPLKTRTGTYTGFPEGIIIDANTGAINVSKSDAGLKYKVSFIAAGVTDTFSTFITIAGINYLDGFYKLNTADSILHPVYNANTANTIPGISNGTLFDIGTGCNSQGCNVIVNNGDINLAQTVRNGVFGTTPQNNDRHEFDLNYAINDASNKAIQTIRVKLYYFNTMSDVTQEVYDIISSRVGTVMLAGKLAQRPPLKPARPRPPCIFIVSH
jgi:hypothetical protein